MDKHLENDTEDASDPRLIPGIYNYCLTRCDECAFTTRCLTFRQMRADETQHPGRSAIEQAGANASRTFGLLKTWCESAGIDFDRLHEDARSEHAAREEAGLEAGVERDPIHQLAIAYTKAAFELVSSLDALAPFHEWPASVGEALATIGWHAGLVSAKVDRALHGCAESGGDECRGSDRIQNDWNGSAKVARLAIAESLRAWDTLLLIGQAPADAPLRKTRELLDRIDRELASRFPEAMDFVRPGFDEPEVADGALTTRGGDERPRGVRAWLQRVAVGWPRRS